MNEIRIDDKEVIVMNLVHYFVTEKNYNPVVVHGINDEIWLENMESDFRIVRIISRYIKYPKIDIISPIKSRINFISAKFTFKSKYPWLLILFKIKRYILLKI